MKKRWKIAAAAALLALLLLSFVWGRYDVPLSEVVRILLSRLFPVEQASLIDGIEADENQLYIFEPDPNSIFNEVLPMFVLSTMQEITIENRSSEQAARVMAMQSANDNAHKLLDQLQLEYNKLRQQSITTELLDIIGGQVER